MAAGLRYLSYSPKLFKLAYSESFKQLQHLPLNSSIIYNHLRYSTMEDVKDSDASATTNSDSTNEPQNLILPEADKFGSLRVSLERQQKIKNQKSSEVQRFSNKRQQKFVLKSKPSKSDKFSNEFGNLTDDSIWYAEVEEPEEGGKNILFYPEDKKFLTARAYLKQMKLLVAEKKIKEALELFPDMRENKIFPIHANYTFMIGACGRVGYTEMAFNLLKQMVDRRLRPTPATLTGLFNACAECPFPEYGLKKINILKEKIAERNWLMTKPTYRALIKAYGKCGDLLSAFQTVDEMIEAGIAPDIATYNFLLMSCISDKEAGFTHALEVWRKLKKKKMIPDEYTFNLLLRAARDCGIGPQETSDLLLQHWSSYIKRPYGFNAKEKPSLEDVLKLPNPQLTLIDKSSVKQITADSTSISSDNKDSIKGPTVSSQDHKVKDSVPEELMILPPKEVSNVDKPIVLTNLLSKRPVNGPIFMDLVNIQTASDRLALLGNVDGFLETIVQHKAIPDIKTFTLLLENLPADMDAEEHLISLMDTHKVKPDTDFFNILIKRRNVRNEFTSAKQVLGLIHRCNLSPDIVTFGVLALGCDKRKYGQQLLRDMKQLGYRPNVEIMGALISSGCVGNDFDYIEEVLQTMMYQSIKPNEIILKKVESKVEATRKLIIDKEQKRTVPEWITDKTCKRFYQFCDFYTKWLKQTKVELDDHPWDQYKTDINKTDIRNITMPLL